MKDSQQGSTSSPVKYKYIKANNERFSTFSLGHDRMGISISRRIMKDSQPLEQVSSKNVKYIKANNERFSTDGSPRTESP